jgi:hypothetical protein
MANARMQQIQNPRVEVLAGFEHDSGDATHRGSA